MFLFQYENTLLTFVDVHLQLCFSYLVMTQPWKNKPVIDELSIDIPEQNHFM